MKSNRFFLLSLLALLMGVLPASADQVTLASWDFTSNVKYSGTTADNVTYYTPEEGAKSNMEYAFSSNRPYFYPTSFTGTQTAYTLSIWSADTSKKWYISDFNSGALRMYTAAPKEISNFMDPAQQYNYAEVTFPATGYKNVQLSFKMSGNNGQVVPSMVVVSTDGGQTWMNAGAFNTGASWSSFAESSVSLSVAGCQQVIARAVIGYHKGATSDMYMNGFKVTAEPLDGTETFFNGSVAADDATHGYAVISPAGGVYESGTQLTVEATKFLGYKFNSWQQGGQTVSTANPYTFAITDNTALTAAFSQADMYALTTSVTPAEAGTVSVSPQGELYEAGTQLTLTATANQGFKFLGWFDAAGTQLSEDNPYTITISAATSVVAQFEEAELPEGTAVVLANWDIENGYSVSNNIYTPDGSEWAEYSGWFNQAVPVIRPDAKLGSLDSYTLTAMSDNRWQLCSGYNNHVLRFYNSATNAISDFTDGTQHQNYYEIQFPTKGYRDITVDMACAYGGNAEATLEAVVSTDGGQTWVSAGTYKTAGTWWTYNDQTFNLSVNNKEQVIMRLICGNGFVSNWNLNYIKVNAVVAAPTSANEKNFTLSWPLGEGNDDVTAAQVAKPGLFSVAEYDHGTLKVTTVRSAGTSKQTLFNPANGGAAANDDDALTFTVIPKKGLTFTPKKFSFNTSRWGTGGGKIDVVAIHNGEETVLETALNPNYGNSGLFTECSYDLSGLSVGDEGIMMRIRVYNLAANKEYGFGSVVLTGDVTGEIESVPVYTFSVTSNMDGAGTVTTSPAGNEFDEGTKVTVTASENFGYHFLGWFDAEGNEVSTKNPYSFGISENTALVATYSKSNVYALNLTLTNGAATNLVQVQPTGNYVDGIHYYEEGTDVKLTAVNNRILTFVGWEGDAAGTNAECEIKMSAEKSVTANFSAADYIVGWDLYYDQPAKDRAGDYKAESDNAGMLSLRNAEGSTTGWLTRGIGNGQENGKYAARIWKYLSEKWYFEISFSSKGYENLVISSCLGDDYNTYSVNNVQYSIDGENFTTIGTFNPPARGWDGPKEFTLPAEANDQQRVWIRWMPDRESELVGVQSDYDGTSIAEIFVLADVLGGQQQTATLVSSNPAEGANDVSANGSIILNFDNKIKAGEGVATLDGEEMSPIISGKSAVFKYAGLKYGTDYTFQMPEGLLLSRSGEPVAALTLHFTTMERQQPEKRLYDAVVAQDGSGDYETLQMAIDRAPEGRAKPWLIFVKNGQYNEHIDIPASKPYIHIIGQDRDKAVVLDNRLSGGDNAYSVDPGATVVVKGENTFFENITLENSWGHEKQAGPQALALNTVADRVVLNNVALLSYQDTWITTSKANGRHYIKNSLIEGAVDFIYNSGNVYLDGDTIEINRPSGGYIVAPSHTADTKWGYVFQNNILRAHPGVNVTDVWLGRPWHNQPKTVFINLQTFINIPAAGWYETMGGLPVLWADYNTVDANGNPVDLSQRRHTYYRTENGERIYGEAKNYLTDEEAAQYTIKNVMGGDDGWQPDLLCEACDAPTATVNGSAITWDAVPYAICYVVTKNGKVAGFTTETSFEGYTAGDKWQVQAVNENGGLSQKAEATVSTGIRNLSQAAADVKAEAVYTVDGRRMSQMQRGLNILRMSDGRTVKVVVK